MKVTYGLLEISQDALQYAYENAELSGLEMISLKKILQWASVELKLYLETKQEKGNAFIREHAEDGKMLSATTKPEEFRRLSVMIAEMAAGKADMPCEVPFIRYEHFAKCKTALYDKLVMLGIAEDLLEVPEDEEPEVPEANGGDSAGKAKKRAKTRKE